ncbi:MAG TPA: hypothetical protein DEB31_03450 [Clostridiales bacterium]|nr:hypothetical protein [Clostridiales bacterium]
MDEKNKADAAKVVAEQRRGIHPIPLVKGAENAAEPRRPEPAGQPMKVSFNRGCGHTQRRR